MNAQQMCSLGQQNYSLCRQTLPTFPPVWPQGQINPGLSGLMVVWASTSRAGRCSWVQLQGCWELLLLTCPWIWRLPCSPACFPCLRDVGGFQILRVEDRADELFHGVCIVQELW